MSQFVSGMSQIWRVAPFCESHSITGTPTPTELMLHYCAKQYVITPILYIVYSIHIIWFIIQNNQKISQIYLQAQIPRCLAKSKLHCVLSKEASHTLLDYNMLTCPSLTTLVQQRRHQADTLVPPNLHFSLYLSPYRTYTYAENRHSTM